MSVRIRRVDKELNLRFFYKVVNLNYQLMATSKIRKRCIHCKRRLIIDKLEFFELPGKYGLYTAAVCADRQACEAAVTKRLGYNPYRKCPQVI